VLSRFSLFGAVAALVLGALVVASVASSATAQEAEELVVEEEELVVEEEELVVEEEELVLGEVECFWLPVESVSAGTLDALIEEGWVGDYEGALYTPGCWLEELEPEEEPEEELEEAA
jgi:hypothetical protein